MTFTNGPENRHVGEFGQCASSGDVLSSRFVNGDEIFAGKDAEMATSGTLQAVREPDIPLRVPLEHYTGLHERQVSDPRLTRLKTHVRQVSDPRLTRLKNQDFSRAAGV